MAFIDMSDEPVFIKTTKKEYNKDIGGYIIQEYEEVEKPDKTNTL